MLDTTATLALALLTAAAPLQEERTAVRAAPEGVDVLLAELKALDGDVACSYVRELAFLDGAVAGEAILEIDEALVELEHGNPPGYLVLRKSVGDWIAAGRPDRADAPNQQGYHLSTNTYARAGERISMATQSPHGLWTSLCVDDEWSLNLDHAMNRICFRPIAKQRSHTPDVLARLLTPLSCHERWRERTWAAPWIETRCANEERVILSTETRHEGGVTSSTHIVWRDTDRFPELALVQQRWRVKPDEGGPERLVVNSYLRLFLPAPRDGHRYPEGVKTFPFVESIELQWSSEHGEVEIVRSTLHRSEILREGHGVVPRLELPSGARPFLLGIASGQDRPGQFGRNTEDWPAAIRERILLD